MLEKIGRNIGKIFLGIVAIGIFIFGYQCGGNKNTSKTDSNSFSDTLITYSTDTIYQKDTIVKFNLKPTKVRIDTLYKIVYLDSDACNRVYVYEDSIKTKEYDIYSKAYVQGLFRNLDLDVKLKVPLQIVNSTTVTINKDSLIVHPYKYEIHAGMLATPKVLAPMIDLSIDKWTYSLGYDPFNKQPVVSIKYRVYEWCPKKRK